MKNDFLWAKTLLSVYRYLERISGAIDKIIMQSAMGSANVSPQNYYYTNIFSISQKLINLSQRKVTLINLKVLIEDTLKEIDVEEAKILIDRFFDGVKFKDLIEKHGISMRTVFRRIDSALNSFSTKLVFKGFDDKNIAKMVKNESWIINVYERLSNQKEENISLSNVFLAKAACLE